MFDFGSVIAFGVEHMMIKCLNPGCFASDPGTNTGSVIRAGFFFRRSSYRKIQRFRCKRCGRSFSQATASACFGQHKREVNLPLWRLLGSGVSMRRSAKLVGIHQNTVARKLAFLGAQAREDQKKFLIKLTQGGRVKLSTVQFDEMETFEHTKCKPLSLALAVNKSRHILGIEVSSMPAKGLLSAIARRKYGPRADEREDGLGKLFKTILPLTTADVELRSDQCPRYPGLVKKYYPHAAHHTTKGGRGCSIGQGELKKLRFDPLFALNHTAAMIRANVNRLFRRTWCTTKKPQALYDHLSIYVSYHNRNLIKSLPKVA